jgi:copper homeostasis protein
VPILLEACLDSVDLARAAEWGGASRIELCDRLDVGGTTPSVELIETVVAAVRIPVFAIVRPRGGDFFYSESELDTMKRDATMMKGLGVRGLVVGVLNANDTIDAGRTREVIDAGDGLSATFHLAFERVPNRRVGLETLIKIGVSRLLTKGGGQTALDGADGIRDLVDRAAGRITIMAGGSVREQNVGEIVRRTGVVEIHTRGLAVADILARGNAAGLRSAGA